MPASPEVIAEIRRQGAFRQALRKSDRIGRLK